MRWCRRARWSPGSDLNISRRMLSCSVLLQLAAIHSPQWQSRRVSKRRAFSEFKSLPPPLPHNFYIQGQTPFPSLFLFDKHAIKHDQQEQWRHDEWHAADVLSRGLQLRLKKHNNKSRSAALWHLDPSCTHSPPHTHTQISLFVLMWKPLSLTQKGPLQSIVPLSPAAFWVK